MRRAKIDTFKSSGLTMPMRHAKIVTLKSSGRKTTKATLRLIWKNYLYDYDESTFYETKSENRMVRKFLSSILLKMKRTS
jgi:hypothetical protein